MDNAVEKYFRTTEFEEIEEIYEQEIFELKQFFLSKAPIAKLFKGRLDKLKRLQEAYECVNSSQLQTQHQVVFPTENTNLLESYQAFQTVKNNIKLLLSNELNGRSIAFLVNLLIDLEKQQAQKWFSSELILDESVIVSKEPNPIEILDGIKQYQLQGGQNLEQLKRFENNPPNVLIQEMKRLSLLFKKY